MTYTPIYSLHGAEPAPLPDGMTEAEAEALGYVIAAPRPMAGEGEEVFWNGRAWAARPAHPAPQAGEGEGA